MTPDFFGVSVERSQQVLEGMTPPARKAGEMVGSVNELVDKLKNEAKVI